MVVEPLHTKGFAFRAKHLCTYTAPNLSGQISFVSAAVQ